VGIDVSGIKEIDPGFKTDVDEATGFGYVRLAPGFEEVATATEGAGAETECGYFEAGASEKSVFHVRLDAAAWAADAEETSGLGESLSMDNLSC
jgi:hypothetical protein